MKTDNGRKRTGGTDGPLVLFLLLFLLAFPVAPFGLTAAVTSSYAEGTEAGPAIPTSLLYLSEKEANYALLVDKSEQRLYLYQWEGDEPKLLKSYACSTGQNPGSKSRKGDKRTPDGVYFFTRVIESKNLAPKYGIRAYPTDYPNFLDRLTDKNGDGIWLHGTDQPLSSNKTKGCIVLENRDVAELSNYIRLRRTPIVIEEKVSKSFPEDIKKQQELIKAILEEWRQAWEEKQLDRYMSFYAKKFRSGNKDWLSWRDYKDRLNRQYREISVTISDPVIIGHGKNILAVFYQSYKSDLFSNEGTKRLYFDPDLKIIGEEWDVHKSGEAPPPIPEKVMHAFFRTRPARVVAREVAPIAPAKAAADIRENVQMAKAPEPPVQSGFQPLAVPAAIAAVPPTRAVEEKPEKSAGNESPGGEKTQTDVRTFLELWRTAWETKDIDAYMNCYSRTFRGQGKNWDQWKQHKLALNKVYSTIKVSLRNVNVGKTAGTNSISFDQHYQSDTIKSIGRKNLEIIKENNNWKIVRERFSAVR